MQTVKTQRLYKDRLFRRAFREKEHLLALYNAINGSHYDNPEDLEIRTLENVVYMGMKNDVAFMLEAILNLYEHQSSFNPNMPLRGLGYFSSMYQRYIDETEINIYSSRLQPLPFPQYIVFYNGTHKEPDRIELKLSDAFICGEELSKNMQPCLEVRTVMLNINWGHNRELMEQCLRLQEYSQCIAIIREYEARIPDRQEAVTKALDECIKKGLLADILAKEKSEVVAMFLTEYDEEKHMRLERKEAWEEARTAGIQILLKTCRKFGKSWEETSQELEESYSLTPQDAQKYMEKFWV